MKNIVKSRSTLIAENFNTIYKSDGERTIDVASVVQKCTNTWFKQQLLQMRKIRGLAIYDQFYLL